MNHPNLSKIYGRYLSREAINSMLDHEGNNAKANPFKHVGTLWGLDKAAKDAPVEQIVTKRAA